MKDIQNQYDGRRVNIRKVGVKGLSYPIIVLDKAHRTQKTVAAVNMYVNLPHQFKGTHMSRFVEILNRFHDRFTLAAYQRILEEMKIRLDAEAAHLEMSFPYFFAPQGTKGAGLAHYSCRLYGSLAETLDLVVEVAVPVPAGASRPECSASTLWGQATVAVRMLHFLWIEDLIALVEEALTRCPQEYTATVEGGSAAIARALEAAGAFSWYKVLVKNLANGYASLAVREWPDDREAYGPLSAASLSAGPPASVHNLCLYTTDHDRNARAAF